MMSHNVVEKIRQVLEPRLRKVPARVFVTRQDGVSLFDSVQDTGSQSISALVSGVWQASEALMGFVNKSEEVLDYRFSFDTSSNGIFLFPLEHRGAKFYLGAIYDNCLNPALLKRQMAVLKDELQTEISLVEEKPLKERNGFLFQEISDAEMDRLFGEGRI